MEMMNCFVRGNNGVDGSGCLLPEAIYQQQWLTPVIPFSMMMGAAAAASASASASGFHVNYQYPSSYLDCANSMVCNGVGSNRTEEVDRYLLMQIEQLKSTLQQQWKQNLSSLAMNLEAKFIMLLMQKDKDLAEEKKGAMKLLIFLKKALLEKEKWENIARKLNSMVSTLKQTLEQVQKPCYSSTGELKREEEIASCLHSPKEAEEEEDDDDDEPSAKRKKLNCHGAASLCQICGASYASVLILPCRHLCLCKKCEVLQCMCPVCKCVKKETMEVILS